MKIISVIFIVIILVLMAIALMIDLTPSLDVKDGELGFVIRIFTLPALSLFGTLLLIGEDRHK